MKDLLKHIKVEEEYLIGDLCLWVDPKGKIHIQELVSTSRPAEIVVSGVPHEFGIDVSSAGFSMHIKG